MCRPSAVLDTVNVMYRVIALAPICTVPTVLPAPSMKRCPKPCTSISRFQAEPAAMV